MKNEFSHIHSAKDLREEIHRLKIIRDQQEIRLKESFEDLQETVTLKNITTEAVGSFIQNVKEDKTIADKGIQMGAHMLVENILFRRRGPLVKFVAENVLKFAGKMFLKKTVAKK